MDGGLRTEGCALGCGALFNITPSGTVTTLYDFCPQTGCPDGETPGPGLLQGTDGAFYGATQLGGQDTHGTFFKLSAGLKPFVEPQLRFGTVGTSVKILGTNLIGTSGVSFGGTPAAFQVISASEIIAFVPAGE